MKKTHSETYRSGHNENDSKSFCLHGHEGSNPSVSAIKNGRKRRKTVVFCLKIERMFWLFDGYYPKILGKEMLYVY